MSGYHIVFANRATASLAAPISAVDTLIPLAPAGAGSLFPVGGGDPSFPQVFFATIFDASGAHEIILVNHRTGDVIDDVSRGRDGTLARAWDTTARIEMRLCAELLENFIQTGGDGMQGDLYMAGNAIHDAVLVGDLRADVLKVNALKAINDLDVSSILQFPTDGTAPMLDGSRLLTRKSLERMVFMFHGFDNEVVLPFTLCNGANNTPDLRDRFIVGSGPLHAAGSFGPTVPTQVQRTSVVGNHDHDGVTVGATLSIAHLPPHKHTVPQGGEQGGQTRGYSDNNTVKANASQLTGDTGGGQPHAHNIHGDGSHDHTLPEPVYYSLAFVKFHPIALLG